MKIVLDTNVLLRIVNPESQNYDVWQRLLCGDYTICYTTEILFKYEEILTQLYSHTMANLVINFLKSLENAEEVTVNYRLQLIKDDVDDNKFTDCAFAANARYVVTNDKHFEVLKAIPFPKIETLTLVEFRNLLRQITTK